MDKSIITTERLYLTSNENQKQIFENIGIKPKKVLTVGSSIDQAYNALFYGAKDVTIVDISVCTEAFEELKTHALKSLEFDEFLDFIYNLPEFIDKNPDFYNNACKNMSENSLNFWNEALKKSNRDKLNKMLDVDIDLDGSRFYCEKESFYKLQNVLKQGDYNLKIINSNISEIPETLNEKFDLILLSNVDDYFMDKNNKNKINEFVGVAEKLYNNNLTTNGIIQLTSSMNEYNIPKTNFYKQLAKNGFESGEFFTVEKSGLYSTNGSSNVSLFVKKKQKALEASNDDQIVK